MFILAGMNENEVPISTCYLRWVYCLSFWYHNFNSNSVESKNEYPVKKEQLKSRDCRSTSNIISNSNILA